MHKKICLGTVQLGQCYGINNALGRKPDLIESCSLLESAVRLGINFFDTASVYGDAENILGDFGINRFPVKVISKLKPHLPADSNLVLQEIQTSLKNLKLNSLEGYLFHDAEDFYKPELLRGLKLVKEKGLTKNIGVSIYELEDAINIVKDRNIDIIQIPYNVLDQRLDETDFFELAEKNNVTVFARSSFLQGLLLMERENIPPHLKDAWSYIERFQNISRKHGFTPSEAALLFAYCHKKIDYVLFGVDTVKQLESNLEVLNKANQFVDCCEELSGKFKNVNRKIIVPSLWGKN